MCVIMCIYIYVYIYIYIYILFWHAAMRRNQAAAFY